MTKHRPIGLLAGALIVAMTMAACGGTRPSRTEGGLAPVYNPETGRLEELLSDRDGDGRPETRAFMDGAVLKRIEIDRNGDGAPDRWEFYSGGVASAAVGAGGAPRMTHAEEANGRDARVTRREFYSDGVLRRVEDDVDGGGRPDKWEAYDAGVLVRVDLDLVGKGYASQRLVYGPGGHVIRVETDPDGDGVFVAVPARGAGKERP